MDSTIIQVPISKTLRDKAFSAAEEQGFSSLQDFIRLALTKLANRQMVVSFEEPAVKLSAKNEKRYLKMDEDIKKGKNFETFNTPEEFLKSLGYENS